MDTEAIIEEKKNRTTYDRYKELSDKEEESELTKEEEVELIQIMDKLSERYELLSARADLSNDPNKIPLTDDEEIELITLEEDFGFQTDFKSTLDEINDIYNVNMNTQVTLGGTSQASLETYRKDKPWTSSMKFTKNTIIVPEELKNICISIQNQVESDEFSILAKGKWAARGFEVTTDYVIPPQNVAEMEVNYNMIEVGKLRSQGYNVVIHSHPFSANALFSHSDNETINKNFMCSLLICTGGFTDATLKIEVDKHIKLELKPSVEVLSVLSLPAVDISNIKRTEYVRTVQCGNISNAPGKYEKNKKYGVKYQQNKYGIYD